jgi:heptosyltransferase-3
LRKKFPRAELTAVVNDFTAPMLENNPDVDRVLVYQRGLRRENLLRRAAHEWQLFRAIRRAKFDLLIDLTGGDRPAGYALLSGALVRISFTPNPRRIPWKKIAFTHLVPPPRERMHQTDRHFKLLAPLGISGENPPFPKLQLTRSELDWARAEQKKSGRMTAVAHFTASWMFKCWDDARAAAVMDWLASEKKMHVWFTCGSEAREIERAKKILALCRTQPELKPGVGSLRQLAALIAVSEVFVGVDTGPMHIAAATGTPTVGIFGPTGSLLWSPRAPAAVVVEGDCPCQDTGARHCDWTQTRACLLAVTVEQVTATVEKLLAQKSSSADS